MIFSHDTGLDRHATLNAFAGRGSTGVEQGQVPSGAQGDAAGKDEGLSFFDLLDIVNPLQHIPIVSSIYRSITGDEIGAPARMVGGLLFGGVVGLAGSAAQLVLEEATGDDVAGHVMSMVSGDGDAEAETDNRLTFERARGAYERLDGAGEDDLGYEIEIPC